MSEEHLFEALEGYLQRYYKESNFRVVSVEKTDKGNTRIRIEHD